VKSQRKIRTLIVDDEPLARDGISVRLKDHTDIEIVGEAGTGPEAVSAIDRLRPNLLFLDIQMPGMNGFDVLAATADIHLPVVIFVTAYDQYALKAFDVHALDYLLKPVANERFLDALERARQELARGTRPSGERIGAMLTERAANGEGESAYLYRFTVKDGDRFLLVKAQEVDWIQSAANYVRLRARGRTFLLRSTMADLEQRLDPKQFARIHRSTIVNLDRVKEITPEWHGDFDVTLTTGEVLKLSRNYRDRVLP